MSDFLARTFHGLTARRIAVLAGFILVMSVFSFPVAVTYERGLDLRETLLALLLICASRVLWFFSGVLAAIAAYNRCPGSTPARAIAAAIAAGVVVWVVRPYATSIQHAPIRQVLELPLRIEPAEARDAGAAD